jgi:hypothetical protein
MTLFPNWSSTSILAQFGKSQCSKCVALGRLCLLWTFSRVPSSIWDSWNESGNRKAKGCSTVAVNCPSYKDQPFPAEGHIHQCHQSSLDLVYLNVSLTSRTIWCPPLCLTIIACLETFAFGFGMPFFNYMPFWDWWTLIPKAGRPRPQQPCPCHPDWLGRIPKCP